jgi:hypothetical protein
MTEIYAKIVAQSINSRPTAPSPPRNARRDHEAIVMIAAIMDVQPHDQQVHVASQKNLGGGCRNLHAPIEA